MTTSVWSHVLALSALPNHTKPYLTISFLACTKVDLWDLKICTAVNGEKLLRAVTLTLVRQCPILNLSELFSFTTMYLNFMFLDRFSSSYHTKNTHTHTHTHIDSNESVCFHVSLFLCFRVSMFLHDSSKSNRFMNMKF